MEDVSHSQGNQLSELQAMVKSLQSRADDAEDRQRRNNVRVVGLTEGAEGSHNLRGHGQYWIVWVLLLFFFPVCIAFFVFSCIHKLYSSFPGLNFIVLNLRSLFVLPTLGHYPYRTGCSYSYLLNFVQMFLAPFFVLWCGAYRSHRKFLLVLLDTRTDD